MLRMKIINERLNSIKKLCRYLLIRVIRIIKSSLSGNSVNMRIIADVDVKIVLYIWRISSIFWENFNSHEGTTFQKRDEDE